METEEKLAIKFPDLYRNKMMSENGGEYKLGAHQWTLYPFWDKSDKKRSSKTFNDIERETLEAKEWFTFPKDAFVIGHNRQGDKLIFKIDSKDKSRLLDEVYWWDPVTGKDHLLVRRWDA